MGNTATACSGFLRHQIHISKLRGRVALVDTSNWIGVDPIIKACQDNQSIKKRIREIICNLIYFFRAFDIKAEFYIDGKSIYGWYDKEGREVFQNSASIYHHEALITLVNQNCAPKIVFYEADPQIAFQHRQYAKKGIKSFVVSKDSDFILSQVPMVKNIIIDQDGWQLNTFGNCDYYGFQVVNQAQVPQNYKNTLQQWNKIKDNKLKLAQISALNTLGGNKRPQTMVFKDEFQRYKKIRDKLTFPDIIDLVYSGNSNSKIFENLLKLPKLNGLVFPEFKKCLYYQTAYNLCATIFNGHQPQFLDIELANKFIDLEKLTRKQLSCLVGRFEHLDKVISRHKLNCKPKYVQPYHTNETKIINLADKKKILLMQEQHSDQNPQLQVQIDWRLK